MKKFLLLVFILFFSISTFGQTTSGSLPSDETWSSGPIHITGDITIPVGITLTINAGVDIYLASGVDIFVEGTLNAGNNPGSPVIFTASGSNWGHIVFNSTSTGSINNCLFEKGLVTGSGAAGYGGSIYINSNNVSITNSRFENNRGIWGGAIFIGSSKQPTISNSFFKNNVAAQCGGGIYYWNLSGGTLSNCIFEGNIANNNTTEYYTGGGVALQINASTKILNCTFINNDAPYSAYGDDLLLHGSNNARITNCVFWGSASPIYCYGTNLNVIRNCAYTSAPISNVISSPIGSFIINTSNTASDGPNFTDPSSGDWTIQFISPLRDAGTTPSPTVPTDYAGNNRVGAYDIGAYEVPYSRWTGTTSTEWATSTNWSGGYYPGATGSTGDIIIPNGLTNYPTSTPAPSVTISADKYLILESNAKATMASLRNSGILRLESDSTGTASLIMGSYNNNSGAGTEEIELYLSGGSDPNNKWHFISIPIANFDHSPISDTTLNLARYDENSLLDAGWVAYDGYVYYTQTMDGGAFSTLSIGKGYNYFYDRDVTYTLSGRLYTKTVNIGLSYSGSTPGSKVYGFNLLGNPFSSGLDWDAIVYVDGDVEAGVLNDNYPDNTSAAVFFTKDDEQVTYVAGVLSTSDEFDGVIPPMQGFFVKTYSTGNTISLPQAARTHGVKTSLFKGNSRSTIPLIRLGIGKGTEVLDQTVVRFNQKALFGIDNFYDAVKLMKQGGRNYISTTIDTTEFSINGIPFPGEGECFEIPISLTLAEEADYNISVSDLQNLDDYEFSIVDLTTNDTTKITASTTLSFHAAAGELNERFVLLVSPSSGDLPTYTPEVILPKAAADFTIYQSYNMINIEPATGNWDGMTTRVSVINLAGQRVATHNAIEIQSGSISQIEAPTTKGFYLVEIIGNNRRYVGKVVIR
jgi:parallel beta-helix repeat protein